MPPCWRYSVLAVQRRKILRMLAGYCVCNYATVEVHGSPNNLRYKKYRFFRILSRYSFTSYIPPTWRRVVTMTSVASLHFVCKYSYCFLVPVVYCSLMSTLPVLKSHLKTFHFRHHLDKWHRSSRRASDCVGRRICARWIMLILMEFDTIW